MALTPWTRAESGTEHGEQSALFMWCNMAALFGPTVANFPAAYSEPGWAKRYYADMVATGNNDQPLPILSRLYAIKNQGHGDKIRGNLSKAEGVKAGVPDVFLPYPMNDARGLFAGLYIELKRRKSARGAAGRTSEAQDDWLPYLESVGYVVAVCVGWEAARDAILAYLGIDNPA